MSEFVLSRPDWMPDFGEMNSHRPTDIQCWIGHVENVFSEPNEVSVTIRKLPCGRSEDALLGALKCRVGDAIGIWRWREAGCRREWVHIEPTVISQEMKDEALKLLGDEGWQAFRDAGLLWFVNNILHVFGWCIFMEADGTTATPAKIEKFTGFSRESELTNKAKMAQAMVDDGERVLEAMREIKTAEASENSKSEQSLGWGVVHGSLEENND